MWRLGLCISAILLAACAPGGVPERPNRAPVFNEALPPMKMFAPQRAAGTRRANAEIARDFLDLSFQMESGRTLDHMSRFEGPVSVRVTGRVPGNLSSDLRVLLSRLQSEAGLTLTLVHASQPANITIEALPQEKLQSAVPKAACFVVPRVSSWDEFRSKRRGNMTDWTTLTTRDKITIFVPNNVSPQEVRDCLHEELAQALGPLNDLFRLPDSVFNDDNFHTILTGFDMLMLRIYYAPELHSGMTRNQAAAALPAILARLNPAGQNRQANFAEPTSRAWINAIETALAPRSNNARRLSAARTAVSIARSRGWADHRLAFSLFAYARMAASRQPDAALAAFAESSAIYRSHPDTQLHAAHVASHLAIFTLSAGQVESALALVDSSLPVVEQAENAALLSTLLMIRAEILDVVGRTSDARATRLDSLGWARYGFGSDDIVRARLREISSLTPRPPINGG